MGDLSRPNRTTVIDYFGYRNKTSITKYYGRPVYLIFNDLGKNFYPQTFPGYDDKWRFTPDDFKRLNNDPNVLSIYDNGNLEIYRT